MKPESYRVIKGISRGGTEFSAKSGDIVYRCSGYDYGCANDDTRFTGIEHISVTKDPEGGYPFFTIPVESLEAI